MPIVNGTPFVRAAAEYEKTTGRPCPVGYNPLKRHYANGELPGVVKVPGVGNVIVHEMY